MRLILIIAAGILLAFILLPFLGSIVMALVAVVVFAALIYGLAVAIPWLIRSIFIFIAVGKVGANAAKGAAKDTAEKAKQKRSFRATVKTAPEFCRGLAAIKELLILQNLRYRPVGLWYLYILNDRIRKSITRTACWLDPARSAKALWARRTAKAPAPASEASCRCVLRMS